MGEVARSQNVGRWADCTPEHLLYLNRIKETIPNALIMHIIRDGRDVALSTGKLGYVRRKWWDRAPTTMVSALCCDWLVRKGRADGGRLGEGSVAVRVDELCTAPDE